MAAHLRGCGELLRWSLWIAEGGSIDQPRSTAARSIMKRLPERCGGGGIVDSMPRLGMRPMCPDQTCNAQQITAARVVPSLPVVP